MLSAGLRTNCREMRMRAGTPGGRGVVVIQVRDDGNLDQGRDGKKS